MAQGLLEATVEGGTVRGTAEGDLISFKGIPFAQPPVGDLRWRAPQPVKPWDGVLDASKMGPDPIQHYSLLKPGGTGAGGASKGSEDCLYLNVWRPADQTGDPLPVMVWVHGGGDVQGAASQYPMERFTRQGGMVVVSFNYRLSRLGFFAHPALAAEAPDDPRGNYAFMDEIAALQWVQRNIAAFGGDPGTVTIAGESAGGGAMVAMLISPLASGLFHRAIVESPGMPSARDGAFPLENLDAAESRAVEFAREAGIDGNDAKALAALRALPAEKVAEEGIGMSEVVTMAAGGPSAAGFSGPTIDGRLIAETSEAAMRGGRQAMVPVICGATAVDLAVSVAETKDAVFAQFGALASQARKLYDPDGNASFKALNQAVYADRTMIEPTRHLAAVMTRAGQPAYYYRFSYVDEAYRDAVPGVIHGFEMPFVLDLPISFDGKGIVQIERKGADLEMVRTASGYWANFVRTGDPNGAGLPEWPRYDPATGNVMDFANTGAAAGPDPLKARLDLWQSVWDPAH
ncbi:carboxylesterase family protein [Streptomyces sp. NBC_00047]|uniref:carboxylesterase/lipase family protein n=1 Tax=unclassified Streptomyces TaxID=2593676 RepID=UPI00214D00D9|nr:MULTISPECIES: carboxylesterase family protein [unclassified Streptomyces]MCX5613025.1 carboxylesterase family protein [Streptomyces sp. NBC_00047]UUU37837.1 carboxylesterase family protein [Streptomyces sp. NBC_00162]